MVVTFHWDLHVFFNYQKVINKGIFEVGMKDLAKAPGFTAETLTSMGMHFLCRCGRHFIGLYMTFMFACRSSVSSRFALERELIIFSANLPNLFQRVIVEIFF